MPLRGYVARLARELWEIRRLGDQLLHGQPPYGQAQTVAKDFVRASAIHREQRIILVDDDGSPIDSPIKPQGRRPLFRA